MRILNFLLAFLLLSGGIVCAREVKFIHITDANINTQNAPYVLRTIKEINQYKDIDFVVFGGNNISTTNIDNLNTFLYLLKRVNKKTIVLLGNTDVLESTGIDKKYYLKRVKKARRAKLSYHSKKTNYVFSKKGYKFIVMDGSKQYFQTLNGYYPKQELIWLDKKLTKFKNKNVIILQHFPLLEGANWVETARRDEYLDILKKHNNVKMIVSGHYGDNVEVERDGIYHIITESYNKNGAYKIIKIDLQDKFIGTYLVK